MEDEFDFMLDTNQELTNEFLEQQLLRLPKMIYNTELFTLGLRRKVEEAKQALKDKEAELINTGVIDGKNKEARDAQLLTLTKLQQRKLSEAEQKYQEAVIELNLLKNYHSTYKAICRLRSGGD
ncbi:MAG TPA: hypothetical protein PLS98_08375 [Dictyoglomaceae bacterium]|nr:hypothetical protein [Dictyoglomaceae bacterium]